MGNKIITEKDFWQCEGGLMPTQFQSGQSTAKKKSGEKYITKMDTVTVSFADFSCKKLMLIMAILAALIAVATVATGGAALIAIGAIAGAAGAAYGAVLGSLLCGQMVAKVRKWESGKENFKILGIPTITGDHVMLCPLFGDKITFAPEIKTWGQALAKGGANLIGGILEGMMAGALIGMGGAAIGGGRAALTSGGGRGLGQAGLNFLKSAPNSIMSNFGSGMFGGTGFKALDGVTNVLNVYGDTGQAGISDFTEGVRQSAQGDAEAVKNVCSGNGKVEDYIAVAMLLIPGAKKGGNRNNHITSPDAPHGNKPHGDADGSKPKDGDDGGTTPRNHAPDAPETKKGKDGESYEADNISTLNQSLKDGVHPVTGVPFKENTVEVNGQKVKGVFPEFESKFDADLPNDKHTSSDYQQFKESTKQLKMAIEKDPSLKDKFTDKQLKDIMDEEPYIDNLTWHHKEAPPGKMQLVDRNIHNKTNHTGGKNIWGGGSSSR